MDKQSAIKLIRETFEKSFDEEQFVYFIKNLFNKIEIETGTFKNGYYGQFIPESFKPHIKMYKRIGKYNDGNNRIDVLVVYLEKEKLIERARTMQRNFIAGYLAGKYGSTTEKNAALVAFISLNEEDWRFSLVKMEYKLTQTKTGRPKGEEEFTPAKRFSFLVGKNEPNHTAQSRLYPILKDVVNNPKLTQLEDAFNIETVTKEFFLKYRALFLRTKEELDRVVKNDPKVEADFEAKSVDTVNFAKKLLGQIIFLYFLQKKGWFGVGRDDDWGTGSKHFLRELFDKKHGDYKNFFNDILEPLFYEALRIDRSYDDDYYSRFDCKIPFLNGGLFDPIGNYDWVHTDIIIPDKLFSNSKKTKEGDTGDGILDIFDRYNFTVKEDEPLEKEVAIDPELLGKAYEKFNAIRPDNYDEFKKALKSGKKGEENKFNKKFGVYYTPREIVHYMCQQSLINYLETGLESKVKKEAIEFLILEGEKYIEHLKTAKDKKEANKNYRGYYKEKEHFIVLKKHASEIDNSLSKIKVCDPAVGSGAFPVGMMTEIIKSRMFFVETGCLENIYINSHQEEVKRTTYNYKRDCIEHSLYGVDIDPGAVEIAKLRLWLSLVVDEDDIKNIKPLPNLDYRIMQGNSLISEFMGINFDSGNEVSSANLMFKGEADELIEQFQQRKDEFLNESNVTRKSKLKNEVDNLLIKIFETKLRAQKADYFNRLKNIENKYSVLRNEKQRDELIKQDKEKLYKEAEFDLDSVEIQLKEFTSGRKIKPFFLWNLYFSEVFHQKGGFDVVIANPPYVVCKKGTYKGYLWEGDLYSMFFELSLKRLLRNCAIFSFITPRFFLFNQSNFEMRKYLIDKVNILSMTECKPFDAVTENEISIIKNDRSSKKTIDFHYHHEGEIKFLNVIKKDWIKTNKYYEINPYLTEKVQNLLLKIYKDCRELGCISITKRGAEIGKSDLKMIKKGKPILIGYDVGKYSVSPTVARINQNHKEYVRLKEYFEKNRLIILRRVSKDLVASITDSPIAFSKNLYAIIPFEGYDYKFICSLINSSLLNFYYKRKFSTKKEDVFPEIQAYLYEQLPIKRPTDQQPFILLVDRILSISKDDDYFGNRSRQNKVRDLEKQIDQLVYKLYSLTPEEIRIVEAENENAD